MNYNMYDEMMEQPDSLRKTFESEMSKLNDVSKLVSKVDKVYCRLQLAWMSTKRMYTA